MLSSARTHLFLLCLVILPLAASPATSRAEQITLRVGVYDNKPTIFVDEEGRPRGLFIDILKEIALREGWRLEYVEGHFSEVLALLRLGDLDLLPALAYSEEREKTIDYTNETVLANWAELYVPVGHSLTSLLDLEGMKVAVKQGDIHFTALKKMVNNFNISCRFFETDEYTTVFEMLQADYVQVGVVNRLYGNRNKVAFAVKETPVIFNPIEMRYGAPRGKRQEILAKIDSYLVDFVGDEESVYYRSLNKWLVVDTDTVLPSWLAYVLIAGGGIALLLAAAVLLFRHQVKKRTRQLTEINARLEEEIGERARAEETLQRFARIVETASDAIVLADRENRHVLVNRAYVEEIAGAASQVRSRTVREVFGEVFFDRELRKGVEKCLAGERVTLQVGSPAAASAKTIWDITLNPYYAGSGEVAGYVMDMRNVTPQVELQNRYKNAQKMEAIGMLAGGVAHDLNNILSGLVSYPDMLLVGRESDDPMTTALQTIKRSGERAAAIVQDLLTLARRGGGSTEPLCLNTLIRDFMASPEYAEIAGWSPGVKVRFQAAAELLPIEGCAPHLEKALMNLVANAIEAIEGEGKLTISTANVSSNEALEGYEVVPPGEYVLLQIADTGVGMDTGQLSRVFEPFYSSKTMGRSGTGLGMAIVWGVVKDHNAYIDIDSVPNRGTTFGIYFPATRKPPQEEATTGDGEITRGGGESVLVVDDMEEQRKLASRILEMLGYQVDTAASGEEAVEMCRSRRYDILLLDMIMPGGMGGLETYEAVCTERPGQKAVIASGYSDQVSIREAQSLGAGSYISKPYTIRTLAQALYRELQASP